MESTIYFRPPASYIMTGPAIDMPAVSQRLPGICTAGPADDPEARVRNRVLTPGEMMPMLRATGRYCVHHGSTRRYATGNRLLKALSWMDQGTPTQCDFVHQAKKGAKQRNEDLWFRRIDETTAVVLVHSDGIPIWHADEMDPPPIPFDTPEGMRNHMRNQEHRSAIYNEARLHIAAVLHCGARRLEGHDTSVREANDAAVRAARAAMHATGEPDENPQSAIDRFTNVYDRAYHRTRIELAGVDLNDHPEFHHYQAFYDLGWAPPSRQEMADHIIATFAN